MFNLFLVERWPFWFGGAVIGLFVIMFLLGTDRLLSVSTGFVDVCSAPFDSKARRSWRLPFLVGIVGGGALATFFSGQIEPTFSMGLFDLAMTASLPFKAAIFFAGGAMIGFGARLAGGCTSGHSIVGTALLSPASWISTAAFMVAGFLVTNILYQFLGA